MKVVKKLCSLSILLFTASLSNPSWAACNSNETETGASTVTDMQGNGNFACGQIASSAGSMRPVQGFSYQVVSAGPRRYVAWSAPTQVDKIFVTTSGQGGRCLYDFETGPKSGSYLEPSANSTSSTTVVACSDGINVAEPPLPPKKPISTTTNCADALPGLQSNLDADGNIITLIGIGTDQGLNSEGAADGDYVLAVCSAGSQTQCADQCLPSTGKTYACSAAPGKECLTNRACATSDELPTGNADAPQYCWELSHGVNITAGTFTPPIEKETGNATWEQYDGSTCVKVTTTYRGATYSYYSPTGCTR